MIFNLSRLFIIVLFVLFQYSFLNLLFPKDIVPSVISVFVVSYVAILGFEKSWKWVVVLGVLVDLFTFSVVGKNVIIFVLLAYLVSLISRRFLLEKHEWRMLVIFFIVFFVTIFYNTFTIIWPESRMMPRNILWITGNFWFFLKIVFAQSILNTVLFYVVNGFVEKFEKGISLYDRQSLNS